MQTDDEYIYIFYESYFTALTTTVWSYGKK